MAMHVTRREFLRRAGVAGAGLAAMLAGCQPAVVKETVVVEKEVEKIVKETVVVEKIVEAVPTKAPVKLMAWSWFFMDPDNETYKPWREAVLGYMRDELPDVTLEYKDMSWDEVLRQNLVTALLGGTAPDLIVNESYIVPYARIGAYLPLDDTIADVKDNIVPGTYRSGVWEGKIYGLSTCTSVFAFENNSAVVEKAGLDPNEWPQTWSQLLERCQAITKAGNGEYYGYTLQGPVGFMVGGIMRYSVYAAQASAPMCKEDCTHPFFDDPKLEPVLSFLREINRFTPPGLSFNPDEGQVYQQLHMGVTAYQIGAAWHRTWAKQHQVEDVIKWGQIPIPDKDGKFATTPVGNLMVLALSGTKNPREALHLIKIVSTYDDVLMYGYHVWDRTPPTYSGLKKLRDIAPPSYHIFIDILERADVGLMPQWPKEPAKVWTAFNEMMMKILSTEDPIPSLQAEAQAAAEKAIAEAG